MTATQRKRFLDQSEIDAGIGEVAGLAAAERVAILLVGGCALHYYGSDRLTAGIDFVAEREIPSLPVVHRLSFGGVQSHTPGGVPVDWIVRSDDYAALFEEALQHPQRLPDLPVPIVGPEYLVAMKMVARRKKDAADLETLVLSGAVDIEKARRIVKRLLGPYAAEDLDAVVAEAEWQQRRGR